jgi:ADP-glucose pyrophosphorylase
MERRVLAMVLAGGKGTRLHPLTLERANPAVPFGGKYRIVDFVLSNLVNSGVYSTYVLTQFKSQSLLQHLRNTWQFGGLVRNSVLGRAVRVHSGAIVEDSVIFDNCDIGRNARVRRAILDKNVLVAEGVAIGYDLDNDRSQYHVSENDIVVVEGVHSSVEVTVLRLSPTELKG